ncbi:hypothetical protein P8452_38541 [Trifolium repens]|nr:hypothetical protein P8452_38541 [Trifolium repens]
MSDSNEESFMILQNMKKRKHCDNQNEDRLKSLAVTSTTLQILYLVPDLLEPKLPAQQNSHVVLILWRLKNLTLLHLPIFIFVELKSDN